MITPPQPSDPGRQAPEDARKSDQQNTDPQSTGDTTARDAENAWAGGQSAWAGSRGDNSSSAEPYPSPPESFSLQSESRSAQAEEPEYPEAGSPYAAPGSVASEYGQPSYDQAGYGQYPAPQSTYGSTGYGQPEYGAGGPPAPISEQNEQTMALVAHLGALGALVLSGGTLGWLVPLIIYLINKDRSPYVRMHAAAALNFQITLIIAAIVSVVLMIVLIGFLTISAVVIAGLVLPIMGAVAASDGRPYRYPLTPSMVK